MTGGKIPEPRQWEVSGGIYVGRPGRRRPAPSSRRVARHSPAWRAMHHGLVQRTAGPLWRAWLGGWGGGAAGVQGSVACQGCATVRSPERKMRISATADGHQKRERRRRAALRVGVGPGGVIRGWSPDKPHSCSRLVAHPGQTRPGKHMGALVLSKALRIRRAGGFSCSCSARQASLPTCLVAHLPDPASTPCLPRQPLDLPYRAASRNGPQLWRLCAAVGRTRKIRSTTFHFSSLRPFFLLFFPFILYPWWGVGGVAGDNYGGQVHGSCGCEVRLGNRGKEHGESEEGCERKGSKNTE